MHAVFVIPRFYPYRGGYENSMLGIARCLVSRGHDVTVFTTTADDLESFWLPGCKTFPAGQFDVDGIKVRRFSICYKRWRRRATRIAGLLPYWRWKAQYWTPSFRVPGLNSALREVNADVYHVGPLPYNNIVYAGVQAAEFRRAPVVATPCVHLGEAENDEVVGHYLQPYQVRLLRQCDAILCMTEVERSHLEGMGIAGERLDTIGLGIDVREATGGEPGKIRQQFKIDGPVVLHLGTKAYDKGSETLVEAMKVLWQRGSNAWLVMAGPSLSAFDRYLASQDGPLPRLVNLPAFADSEKRDLLAAATVVAQPSRVESLGLVMLEAWANGKPVVAADIAVSRKLCADSGAGVVVPFGDSAALAQELERLLGDEEVRSEMGRKGLAAAGGFDGHALFERNARALEEVATRGTRRR